MFFLRMYRQGKQEHHRGITSSGFSSLPDENICTLLDVVGLGTDDLFIYAYSDR